MKHSVDFVKLGSLLLIWSLFAFLIQQFALPAMTGKNLTESDNASWVPTKPITIIVPSNPGGGWDQTARFMQRAIVSNNLSPVPVEVVNKGGAGGTIGLAELVESYEGDPHVLLTTGYGMVGSILIHNSPHSILSATPLARMTSEFQAVGVPASSPYQTLDDLIEAFKKDPQSVSWAGGSAGGSDHIFANLIATKVGVPPEDVKYVAFTGGGEATAALMGGQVTAGINGYAEWGGLIESGRVRLLAVSSPTRSVDPELPTFKDHGIDVVFQNWRGFVAAPGISFEQENYYVDLLTKARATESWQNTLKANQWADSYLTQVPFKTFIGEDFVTTRNILDLIGLGEESKSWAAVGAYTFPTVVGLGLLLMTALHLWGVYRERQTTLAGRSISPDADRTEPGDQTQDTDDKPTANEPQWKQFLGAASIFLLYIFGLQTFGFILVTPPFVMLLAAIIGSKSPIRDLIIGIIITAFIFGIFEVVLNVALP